MVAGSGAWKNLLGGMRIRQVGNYWIKEVNPEASALARWWGRGSLDAQAAALKKLGDMAPRFLYKNGKVIVRDVGEYVPGNFWRTKLIGSWRLRTPMNDIWAKNMGGPDNLIFDPALHPIQRAAYWTVPPLAGYTGYTGYKVWRMEQQP